MIKANVILDNTKWKKKIKNPKNYINKQLKIITKKKIIKKKSKFFTVLLTSSREMKKLNYKFRKKNKSTDVLSFPFNKKISNVSYLGDVAICYEIIKKRSKKNNFFYEFDRIWIHGLLHLLGYRHHKYKDFKIMQNKENKILKTLYKLN